MRYRRTAAVLAVLALAGAGLLGLTACAADRPVAAADRPMAASAADELGVEEAALAALGFDTVELAAAPAASPSATTDGSRGERRGNRPLRRDLLRGRVLHAEAVVRTDEGIRTVLSQRGAIAAIDADTVTVTSADGFTVAWTFGDKLRVVERRRTVEPSALAVGTEIGVAGTKDAAGATASLIVHRVR